MPGERADLAQDIVANNVSPGAVVMSDEHPSYTNLGQLVARHHAIRHADAFAVGPGLHTKLVESFFGRLRRSAMGSHNRISGTYLDLYASSLAWHENTRRQPFASKMQDVLVDGLWHPVSRKFCGHAQGVWPIHPLGSRLPRAG